MRTFKFAVSAGPKEWSALPKQFTVGDTVYEFIGHEYGLVRDYLTYLNRETIACMLNKNDEGFFTVPCEFLVDEASGKHPLCAYMKFPPKK